MSSIKNFLLVFDHSKNELISCKEFGTDVQAATDAYSKMESFYKESNVVDIVLVGSDSIETVKVTHSNYFEDGARNLVNDALSSFSL